MSARSIVEAQLERLEDHWRRLNVPVLDMFAPGLTDQQMDDIAGPRGYTLNDELRAWWGWHNGVAGYDRDLTERPAYRAIWMYNLTMPSLAHAITLSDRIHDVGRRVFPEWDDTWGDWLVLASGLGNLLAGPGRLTPTGPSPVMDYDAGEGLQQVLPYTSLSNLLSLWLGLLDDNRVQYDPTQDRDRWLIDYTGLNQHIIELAT